MMIMGGFCFSFTHMIFACQPSGLGCLARLATRLRATHRYATHSQPHVEQPPQGVLGKHAEKVAPQPLEQPLGGKKLTLVEFSGIDVS